MADCKRPSLPSVKCMNINNCNAAWMKAKPKIIVVLAWNVMFVYRVTKTANNVKTIEAIKPTVCFTIVFMHLTEGKDGRLQSAKVIFAIIITLITVIGTYWVMQGGHSSHL